MRLVRRLPAAVAALFLGCAGASLQSTQVAPDNLPKPSVILVYDFAVSPADLEGSYRSAAPPTAEELRVGRATAASLSEQLVAKLESNGIDAARASRRSSVPRDALLIKGQFLDVDKGRRVKRMVIGFGAGSSRLEARVQAYQALKGGTRRIAQAEATATGSRTPGMAVPVGAGAAVGNVAVSAAVSGGMNITREVRGGIDADAGNMADQISRRIIAYYERSGWR